MAVSAKFVVQRATDMKWATEVELVPDYAQGRNKDWAEATPAGMIRLTIKNDLAAVQFKPQQAVDVLFSFPDTEVVASEVTDQRK